MMAEGFDLSTDAQKHAEEKIELVVSKVLRVGVTVSLVVSVAGLIVAFIQHGSSLVATGTLGHYYISSRFRFPHTFGGVVSGLGHFEGVAIIELGLLLLLFTPIARVAIAAVLFGVYRDKALSLISFVVLAFLALSLVLGKSG